jgi:hypothetical protein
MNVANCGRQTWREACRWLAVFPGMTASEHTAREVRRCAKANSNVRIVTLLASQMLCLGVICFMTAGTQTALAYSSGRGLHAALVPVVCADDCIDGGARGTNSACGRAGCNAGSLPRLAASKRVQPAMPARLVAQPPVAASAVDGSESLFVGAGDMSAGSWSSPE